MTSSATPAPVVNFAENSQYNFDNQDLLKDFENYESGDDTSTNDELYDEDDS